MYEKIRKNRVKLIVLSILLVIGIIFVGVPLLNRLTGPDNEEEVESGDTRVAAVGDSITYDLYVVSNEDEFYPQQLDDLLGEGMLFIILACLIMRRKLLVISLMIRQTNTKKV